MKSAEKRISPALQVAFTELATYFYAKHNLKTSNFKLGKPNTK